MEPEAVTSKLQTMKIEQHSIDFIELHERRGQPRDLFTLFVGGGAVISVLGGGALLVSPTFGFWWAALAVVIGLAAGTALAAFHAAQGPTLGIPQMIQSRAQFGFRGAVFPMLVAELCYIGFFAATPSSSALLIAGGAPHVSIPVMTIVLSVLCAAIAWWGYDLSHRLGRVLTIGAVVVYGIVAGIMIFADPLPAVHHLVLGGGFSVGPFLSDVTLSFIFAAGYAPYVADYSRYFSPRVSMRATGIYTYLGISLALGAMLLLGAYLAAVSGYTADIFGALFKVAAGIGTWFAWVFVVVTTLVTLLQGSLSIYAGTDTAVSIAASFRPGLAGKSLRLRTVAMLPVFVLCTAASLAYSHNFFTVFQEFLNVLVVLLVPWSAVNLIDFYFVRRGQYQTADIFDAAGIYGRWNRVGLASWLLGAACALPFANLTFYVGPVARALGGGDLSWAVSVVVAGALYLTFGPGEERRLARLSANIPSTDARQHV